MLASEQNKNAACISLERMFRFSSIVETIVSSTQGWQTIVMSGAALKEAILPRLPGLSPALRVAADYVINNADSVAMQSLRQIASDSRVAPSTFSRLAKSLDLESYEALRDLCRRDVRHRAGSFADKAKSLQVPPEPEAGSLFERHARASIGNIDDAVANIERAHLNTIVEILTGARCVVAFGALSSAPLIEHIVYGARLALSNWRFAVHGAESVAMVLEDIGSDDVVLLLSQRPYAQSGLTLAHGARERGAKVIVVTDSYTAPGIGDADESLIVSTESPHFFASQVATVLLFETLLSMVVRQVGPHAQRRIAAIENENHQSGEYWQAP